MSGAFKNPPTDTSGPALQLFGNMISGVAYTGDQLPTAPTSLKTASKRNYANELVRRELIKREVQNGTTVWIKPVLEEGVSDA